jgi:uncharacterized protein (DUF697 family)
LTSLKKAKKRLEETMHDIDTTRLETESESQIHDFEPAEFEFPDASKIESPLSEVEEVELATDLLTVSSEAELDQFLGNLLKKAWKGIGKIARPLGGALKGIAQKALPFVGGALGSFIPIPGVGTAVGSALGSAASKLLEAELEGLSPEDREFEMARRFVRFASTAAKRAASIQPGTDTRATIISALKAALQQRRAQLAGGGVSAGRNGERGFEEVGGVEEPADTPYAAPATSGRARSGRWIRRGGKILLLGV